ncbi:MAG TPA: C45 family autoproteolytic acyltransferase/hydrolase [Flavobacteriaceae bacterium]|nr:C45 family autoproteolytic acyltransferase/hydrolase [Flavobacteriaceae bacterium]
MNKSVLIIFIVLFSLSSCGIKKSLEDRPDISGIEEIDTSRIKHSENYYTLGNNSLRKNKYDLWELYVEGKPLERGLAIGSLTRELIKKQENAFFERIDLLVGSDGYLKFLSKVVAWFNRKMYLHVPEEYKKTIYGISRFGNDEYDNFAEPYVRFLYYHAAHDIGHALQDLMLVGCTTFAAWGEKTADGQMLLGRNFDFYVGDEFSEEKIIAFVDPSEGHKFMIYTWGGMIGAVSGMNEDGLTVTINAAKTKIPTIAKTPISLVAREILQYANTIEEAIAIAKKREVFVSESIMVGSAIDKKVVLIEVSPEKTGVYEVENSNTLVCSNHFQSEAFAANERNQEAILKGTTKFRYERMQQLLNKNEKLTPKKAAAILRNRKGVNGIELGMGNERAINQLLSHHGIIFKPEERLVWVSTNPYNLGEFVAYDLDEVFEKFRNGKTNVAIEKLVIPESPFLHSEAYKNYEEFRKLAREIYRKTEKEVEISEEKSTYFKTLNPHYWKTYAILGNYYYEQNQYKKAIIEFKQALRREVTTKPDRNRLEELVEKCYRKI